MPRISDSIAINNEKLDRRVKLTSDQKKSIFENKEGLSQRGLAKKYGVSRRTIQFILNPESLIRNKLRRKERGGWKQYYDKEKHAEYVKEHRDYKKELHQNKLI